MTFLLFVNTVFSSFYENWAEIQNVVEVMRYRSTLLEHQTELVTNTHWDLIVILLASWTSKIVNSENPIVNNCVLFTSKNEAQFVLARRTFYCHI